MATPAHCAFCFEALAASFERRKPLGLAQTETLWAQYHDDGAPSDDADADPTTSAKRTAISRLLHREAAPSAASSSSSLPSSGSSKDASSPATPASSVSDVSGTRDEHPLFVTWNTISSSRGGHKSLRGCIGTFEPQELEQGLRAYALTSAFDDTRFSPIPSSLLPSLSVEVTLLTNFSSPSRDALGWTLGKHGLRISFTAHGRRYGATYLPSVAVEQGWTKEETVVSLMRKSGWSGSDRTWEKTWKEGNGELVTYEGEKVGLGYTEWKAWRDWVEERQKE